MASPSSTRRKYDVFLNFRGSDTRDGFTAHLYEALCLVEINTFIDKKLERGEEISAALLQEIESSSISVVIFSQNYAFSPYCLDELVKIIECKKSMGQSVFPVFYKVDPTDIEERKGRYAEAFAEHKAKFKGENYRLKRWKSALQDTANISGWHITDDKSAPKCIKRIVSTISKKLNERKLEILERKLQELQAVEADMNSQLLNVEPSLRKENEVGNWLINVGRIKNKAQSIHTELEKSKWTVQFGGCVKRMIEEVRELIDQKGSLDGVIVADAPQTNHDAFLTKRLVGQEFQSNMNLILEWLSMDEISCIGIYGMGGVGKTTLMTHIHNKLLENPLKFAHVFWITMSQDFSLYRLQSLIAETIQIDFGKEVDVRKRAARLSIELNIRCRFVLIVDDLWNPFDLVEVGIPIGKNGCKLIVTSRSIDICRRTSCQMIKIVEPLNEEEAWELFIETSGCDLPSNVEMIARSVVTECSGLPLAIVTMAGSLGGVYDLHVWKNALMELQSAIIRKEDMGEDVFRILRYSYNFLNDSTLQQCFLYCALFPEDEDIYKEDLTTYLIVEGIIDPEIDSIQAKYDKGYSMLNKLTNVSLLESWFDGDSVKMHDLMRDMAIQIIKECQPSITESGKGLAYVPDEKYWKKDLVRVSLGWNYITEFPSNFSPSCPNLATLLLYENEKLLSIADSFFDHLQGLKVLDLSHTGITELPESVACLKSLTALFLCHSDIRYIPTLANLKSLQWLDLSNCRSVEKVPDGLEYLSNLIHLNLSWTGLREFPTGILPKLYRLQYLTFDHPSKNVEELEDLWRLEYLKWRFPSVGDFITFDNLISKMPIKLMKYSLSVGCHDPYVSEEDDTEHTLKLNDCAILGELQELHLQIDYLVLHRVSLENGRGLCSHIPAGLKWLWIDNCDGIEYLFSLANSPLIFQSVEELYVFYMSSLFVLLLDLKSKVPTSPNFSFSFSLKLLEIKECSVRSLFPHALLSYLEIIKVEFCHELEEIISVEENSHTLPLSLPNLTELHLTGLSNLKRICSEQIKCECLQFVCIMYCEELKDVSISLPLPYLELVNAHPRQWWESVKWGQPDQKDALPYDDSYW